MPKISDATVEKLKDAPIADVAQHYGFQLKKSGTASMAASCKLPSHSEDKTPSFTVSIRENAFKCFGCGEHGYPMQLVAEMEGLDMKTDFVHIMEKLASIHTIPLEYEKPSDPRAAEKAAERKEIAGINEFARDHFHVRKLAQAIKKDHPFAHYLQNERQITASTIKDFEIGIASERFNDLKDIAKEKNIPERSLVKAGLAGQSKDAEDPSRRTYDFFRRRIIFPIKDVSGTIVGFGGRLIPEIEGTNAPSNKAPKYINTPDNALFNKSRVLYGLHEAVQKSGHPKLERLCITEGYLDVAMAYQAGLPYYTAPMGTSLTKDQIRLAFRHSDDLIMVMDGDKAGHRAAIAAAELLAPFIEDGRTVGFVFLPAGKDVDDFVRENGPAALKELEDKAYPLSQVLTRAIKAELPERFNENHVSKVSNTVRRILTSMPDTLFKGTLINQFVQSFDARPEIMKAMSNSLDGVSQIAAPQPNKPAELRSEKEHIGNRNATTRPTVQTGHSRSRPAPVGNGNAPVDPYSASIGAPVRQARNPAVTNETARPQEQSVARMLPDQRPVSEQEPGHSLSNPRVLEHLNNEREKYLNMTDPVLGR